MPVQQLVDVVQRDILAQSKTECGVQVFGGKEVPRCCLSEMQGKELAFFLQCHEGPAAASAPLTIKARRSNRVVLPQPFPDRLDGDNQ